MPLRVAIQMDPIGSIKPESDSTLLLGIEAQSRGYELFYYTPDKLSWNQGAITAAAQRITLTPNPGHYYDLGEALTLDLSTTDVVLLRQDPPFNMAYITTTYLLEQLHPPSLNLPREEAGEGAPYPLSPQGGGLGRRPLVVNNPASVRNHAEKLFPALFREFMPPTLISADVKEIEHFRAQYKDIVIKPLYGFGGHAVLRLKAGDHNFHALMEMLFSQNKEPWVIQPFLAEVKNKERRIILIDGKFSGILGRIPAEDEIRANLRAGGKAAKVDITPRQRELCAALGPVLKDKGIIFAGVDVIGDTLIEINITSPTTLAPINRLYGKKLEAEIWDAIEGKLSS